MNNKMVIDVTGKVRLYGVTGRAFVVIDKDKVGLPFELANGDIGIRLDAGFYLVAETKSALARFGTARTERSEGVKSG